MTTSRCPQNPTVAMALLIHLRRAVATKWAHLVMPATACLWHLPGPPKLATASLPTTLGIREVVVVAAAGGTTVPLPDTLTTNGCGSGLGPTHGNSAVGTVVGPGLEVAAAVAAAAAIGRKIAAALRPGTNKTVRDRPPDAGPRGIATMMPVVKSSCVVLC